MVAATAEVMGTTLSAPALKLFVCDLAELLTDEGIEHALVRCRRELGCSKTGFPPLLTLKDVLDRADVVSLAAVEDAEPHAAWDEVVRYADKWIAANPWGGYCPKVYYGENNHAPKLPQRLQDTVRRIGGWSAIKTMSDEDFPHVQRRFFEEFQAWAATELATAGLQLDEGEALRKIFLAVSFR